jgi:hypothetical protein
VNAHAHHPRRHQPLAGLLRIADRAIPDPLLALPLVLLALGLLLVAPFRLSGDTWFGLAAGRDIAEHGLPHSDRLMALTAGQPWQDQQWLAHLVSYGLYDLGGLVLVYLVDAGCLIAALALAIRGARSLGGSPMWIAAIASPLLLVQVPSAARAQSYAMPLFALLVWILARDARTPDRRILLVIPILALWANVHGSVLLACVLVLLRCAVGAGTALRAREPRDLGRYALPACAALLAPLASPYGLDLFDYYRSTLTNGAFHALVTEWAGTTLRGWPVFFVFGALAISGILRPEIRIGLFGSLCLLLVVLLGLDTMRNVVWLPYAAVILLPGGLAQWSPETARLRIRPLLMGVTIAGLIGIGALSGKVSSSSLEQRWPEAQGNALARAAAQDPSLRVVSEAGLGDWLLWRYPELRGRIAFDIRFELLGARGLKAVSHFQGASGPTWRRPFRGYRLALWDTDENPEIVQALRAERGSRVLASGDGVYAILRPRVP